MNKIEKFYINWSNSVGEFLKDYLYAPNGKKLKPRFVFKQLKKYVKRLQNSQLNPYEKVILLPGLRGVGKTTLLAQIYYDTLKYNKVQPFYISADRLAALGIKLWDFYEFIKGNVYPTYRKKKILLLIDEIQYDPNWALFLKLVYDENVNNKNLLVIATGSSALFLNTQNQDLVRRSLTVRILPATFREFLHLHKGINISQQISTRLIRYLFFSKNAKHLYQSIQTLRPKILHELKKIPNFTATFKEYLQRGSLPFSATLPNGLALDKIREMVLINIVQKDILRVGRFEASVLAKIPDLLFLLANSDEITTGNLAQTLNLSQGTINKILDTLQKTELLIELPPYGRPYTQVRKSSKFIFITPNIRAALLQGLINGHKGKLLEDYFGLVFKTYLNEKVKLLHSYAKNSADFILRTADNSEIIVETSFNKESTTQIINTLAKTEDRVKYSLLIGSKNLELVESKNIVKIPLEYAVLV